MNALEKKTARQPAGENFSEVVKKDRSLFRHKNWAFLLLLLFPHVLIHFALMLETMFFSFNLESGEMFVGTFHKQLRREREKIE